MHRPLHLNPFDPRLIHHVRSGEDPLERFLFPVVHSMIRFEIEDGPGTDCIRMEDRIALPLIGFSFEDRVSLAGPAC